MIISHINKNVIHKGKAIQGQDIQDNLFDFIKTKYVDFEKTSYISIDELNHYRRLYLTFLISAEKGSLDKIDNDVINAIKNNAILSENIQDEIETKLSIGQNIADKVASFGGSWTFIVSFFFFILLWISINIWLLGNKSFDPYPFILLNLILSCIAAIQAPIIMMSQNRQEQKDRIRAEHDYKINLKAELEIKLLSEKIDYLLIHQNKQLLEIQEAQTDYLEGLLREIRKQ